MLQRATNTNDRDGLQKPLKEETEKLWAVQEAEKCESCCKCVRLQQIMCKWRLNPKCHKQISCDLYRPDSQGYSLHRTHFYAKIYVRPRRGALKHTSEYCDTAAKWSITCLEKHLRAFSGCLCAFPAAFPISPLWLCLSAVGPSCI